MKIYRNVHKTAEGNTYSKHEENSNDVPDRFKEIINAIIGFRCKIEICGSWIWVFNAYPYRKQLKDLGFFWCSKKQAWAWTEEPNENRHKLTLDEIRRLHGSTVIKDLEEEKNSKPQIFNSSSFPKGGPLGSPFFYVPKYEIKKNQVLTKE